MPAAEDMRGHDGSQNEYALSPSPTRISECLLCRAVGRGRCRASWLTVGSGGAGQRPDGRDESIRRGEAAEPDNTAARAAASTQDIATTVRRRQDDMATHVNRIVARLPGGKTVKPSPEDVDNKMQRELDQLLRDSKK